MLNADGSHKIYDYFEKNGELLLKRKNMNGTQEEAMGIDCGDMEMGVDINRNYGFKWEAGDNPCSEAYPGDHPFSEPESRALRDLIRKNKSLIKFVYNFHSYGPMFVWPYNAEMDNALA